MRSAILSVAALAGSALAAPSYGRPRPSKDVHIVVEVETVVVTVYVTAGYQTYKPKPTTSSAAYEAPAKPTTSSIYVAPTTSSVYVAPPAPTSEAPKPTTTAIYTPAPEPTTEVSTPAPEPTTEAPAPTTEAPAPTPTGEGYMGVVAEWRAKLGLSALEQDSKLESNAENVVIEGNGQMVHKLNPGTYGQVLAPGEPTVESFTDVFVGGWLCEIPSLPGLDGICSTMSSGWDYTDPSTGEQQTGHAEILTSDQYTKIGCKEHKGIWCCDLA